MVSVDDRQHALCGSLHVVVKGSGSNLGQLPTFRRFANADSFLFSDPGRVEAQAARAPFEHANLGVFAPLIVPEGATEHTRAACETTRYPTGEESFHGCRGDVNGIRASLAVWVQS